MLRLQEHLYRRLTDDGQFAEPVGRQHRRSARQQCQHIFPLRLAAGLQAADDGRHRLAQHAVRPVRGGGQGKVLLLRAYQLERLCRRPRPYHSLRYQRRCPRRQHGIRRLHELDRDRRPHEAALRLPRQESLGQLIHLAGYRPGRQLQVSPLRGEAHQRSGDDGQPHILRPVSIGCDL